MDISRITTIQRLAINNNSFSGQLPSTMTNLTLMRLFYFHDNDGLCAPADTEFQNWLSGIRDVRGDTCSGGSGSGASASSAVSSAQDAAQQSATIADVFQEDSVSLQNLQQ